MNRTEEMGMSNILTKCTYLNNKTIHIILKKLEPAGMVWKMIQMFQFLPN